MATIKEILPMKLIDKDALVAEIKKKRSKTADNSGYLGGMRYAYKNVLEFIDSLEVKEVDLNVEEELKKYGISSPKTRDVCIASHFYELGLKAQKGEKV